MNTNLPLNVSDLFTGTIAPVNRTSLTTSGKEVKYIDFGKGQVLVSDFPCMTFEAIQERILTHNLATGFGCIMNISAQEYEQAVLKLKNDLSHFPVKQVETLQNVYKLDYALAP